MSPPRRASGAADAAARSEAGCGACLHGGLDQMGLAALLTVLDMERRSGVLLIRRRGEVGRIWLRSGSVIRARTEGSARLTGKVAVYDLLNWSEGRFELRLEKVDGADEIDMPTTHLLMEAAHRSDIAGAALQF